MADMPGRGLQLDLAVAKAIGLRTSIVNHSCCVSGGEKRELEGSDEVTIGELCATPFRPSTSFNDAMWAAGLTDAICAPRFLSLNRGVWSVDSQGPHGQTLFTSDSSGPVAVCKAILKLHEEREQPIDE